MRERLIWISAGLLGLVFAASLAMATSRVTKPDVGLAGEPVSAGQALAPPPATAPAAAPAEARPGSRPAAKKKQQRTAERQGRATPVAAARPTVVAPSVPSTPAVRRPAAAPARRRTRTTTSTTAGPRSGEAAKPPVRVTAPRPAAPAPVLTTPTLTVPDEPDVSGKDRVSDSSGKGSGKDEPADD